MLLAAKVHDRINVQNNPVNAIDPYGLDVFYWGAGATAGLGPPTEGDKPNYYSISGLVVSGTNKDGCREEGLAGQFGAGRIAGLTLGAGFIVGYSFEDIEDFKGRGTAAGITLLFINIEVTGNADGSKLTGLNVGFFKSVGFGVYGVETRTAARTHRTKR